MRHTWLACVALFAALCGAAQAHDVPADVRVQAFVKPEGRELLLLVRVPLAAMREVDVPTRPGGFLELARADGALREAASLWITDNLEVREDDRALPAPRIVQARVSLAYDTSFRNYGEALAHLRGPPIAADAMLFWNQQFMDVLLAYPITSPRASFAMHPRFERMGLKVSTTLRFLPVDGKERAFELHGDPGLVTLDPGWAQAFGRFVALGFEHILDGTDHLLFIACLAIASRRLRTLVIVATAFTIAHSITLALAAMGHAPGGLWFPPLVEVLIAASIVWLALENIFGANLSRRWAIAFGFGLVHGFGFAFALRESLQFAGEHLATALLAFNIGVELGQVAVLVLLVPLLHWLLRRVPERLGVIVLSAIVGHVAWHWTAERWEILRKFPVPKVDAAGGAMLARWGMALIVLGLVAYAVQRMRRRTG